MHINKSSGSLAHVLQSNLYDNKSILLANRSRSFQFLSHQVTNIQNTKISCTIHPQITWKLYIFSVFQNHGPLLGYFDMVLKSYNKIKLTCISCRPFFGKCPRCCWSSLGTGRCWGRWNGKNTIQPFWKQWWNTHSALTTPRSALVINVGVLHGQTPVLGAPNNDMCIFS